MHDFIYLPTIKNSYFDCSCVISAVYLTERVENALRPSTEKVRT